MSLKEEVAEETCSHLSFADLLRGSCATAARTDYQELYHKVPRIVSGHKRPVPATPSAERRNPSQRACRELFSPDHEQAGPSARPVMHPSEQAPGSALAGTDAALNSRQTAPAQVAQSPTVLAPALCVPVTDLWPLMLPNSSQVLHNRLSSSNLLPSTTATGQQLLHLEVQLQTLLGIRKDEEGTHNICWVDHGFLHYSQGILHFHRIYGDAECAQVTTSCPLSYDDNCETVHSEHNNHAIWFCSQQYSLVSSNNSSNYSTLM